MTLTTLNRPVAEDLKHLSDEVLEKINALNESLNPEQRLAAETINGPVIVTAGAGAGKTKTTIHRAATMILAGIHPAYILISTFTKKAADEIKNRLESQIGENGQYVNAGTFHSMVFRNIIKQYPESEFLKSQGFNVAELQILDETESESLFKDAIKELSETDQNIIQESEWKHRLFEDEIGKHRSLGRGVRDYLRFIVPGSKNEVFERITATIWNEYTKKCRQVNGIDYDDILVIADKLMKSEPHVSKELAEKYRYLMLDEYQDTNPVQMSIMDQIARHHRNLFVVGDEKQSIYGFRGSDISIILSFKDRYPEARQVDMVRNYRSYPEIIKHGNALADAMEDKLNDGQLICESKVKETGQIAAQRRVNQVNMIQFDTDRQEAEMVSKAIYRDIKTGVKGEEIFVLYRNRQLKRDLERKLVELNVPYNVIGDTSFFQRREVKDAIALIRFIFQPWDSMAGIRVLQATSMAVSDAAAKKAMSSENVNVTEFLKQKSEERLRAKKKGQEEPDLTAAAKKVSPFMKAIKLIKQSAEYQDDPQFIKEAIAELWDIYFKEKIAKSSKNGKTTDNRAEFDDKIENVHYVLDRFKEALGNGASIEEILEDFALKVEYTPENDAHAHQKVQLMTLHASKGLEADNVYIIGFDNVALPGVGRDGEPPARDEIEESRRLAYVGITRAKKKCALSFGATRLHNGKETDVQPSPFLEEIASRTGSNIYVMAAQDNSHSRSY